MLPLELEGLQEYTPISETLTLDIVRVEFVSSDRMTPFLDHWYVKSSGVPPAVTSIVTGLPTATVCGPLILTTKAGPFELNNDFKLDIENYIPLPYTDTMMEIVAPP